MNSETYVINLIPKQSDLELLDEIKEYFYTQGFKYTSKNVHSRPHLTVAKFNETPDMDLLKTDLQKLFVNQEEIVVPIAYVSEEVTKTEKHPDGEGWVALVFQDPQIKEIYFRLNQLLNRYNINRSRDYVDAIRKIKGKHVDVFDCIANHINLCNRCKPEKVAEAKDYILRKVPVSITFDSIVVRCTSTDEEDVRLELQFKRA